MIRRRFDVDVNWRSKGDTEWQYVTTLRVKRDEYRRLYEALEKWRRQRKRDNLLGRLFAYYCVLHAFRSHL